MFRSDICIPSLILGIIQPYPPCREEEIKDSRSEADVCPEGTVFETELFHVKTPAVTKANTVWWLFN